MEINCLHFATSDFIPFTFLPHFSTGTGSQLWVLQMSKWLIAGWASGIIFHLWHVREQGVSNHTDVKFTKTLPAVRIVWKILLTHEEHLFSALEEAKAPSSSSVTVRLLGQWRAYSVRSRVEQLALSPPEVSSCWSCHMDGTHDFNCTAQVCWFMAAHLNPAIRQPPIQQGFLRSVNWVNTLCSDPPHLFTRSAFCTTYWKNLVS